MKALRHMRKLVAGTLGVFGALSLYTSLAEGVFFQKVIAHGSQEILEHGYTKNAMDFAVPLIANGTIKFLSFPMKAGLAVAGVILIYFSLSIFINLKNPDFGLRSIFSRDYWMKFNAFKYKKTKINSSTAG
jgi:hypothetical protein